MTDKDENEYWQDEASVGEISEAVAEAVSDVVSDIVADKVAALLSETARLVRKNWLEGDHGDQPAIFIRLGEDGIPMMWVMDLTSGAESKEYAEPLIDELESAAEQAQEDNVDTPFPAMIAAFNDWKAKKA